MTDLARLAADVAAIRERLGHTADQASSVQIATSTRGFDVSVKAYVGSPVREAGDAAIDEYVRVQAEIKARLMGG